MTDKQVQEAFYHWMPRFMANNVDYNDLQRIQAGMESWDDWCRAWSELGAEHEALAEEAAADADFKRVLESQQAFQKTYAIWDERAYLPAELSK